jgi:light-regulated signal transduction histidine kinase (bacteriophytochrome)
LLVAYAAVLLFLALGALLFSRLLELRHRAVNEKLINAQLELRVVERTAQLEAANRELEGFSYSVSHDLRSPVRAINSFAQMLREDLGTSVSEESRRMLKVISDNSLKLGKLIEGLLEFARLGRAAIHAADVDMGALAAEVVEEYKDVDAHAVRYEIATMPGARCDPVLMRQVWINLIGNAIKFSGRRDDARIEIGGSQAEGECVYYVRDNGAGFDMAYYKQLFGMFHRLHGDKEFQGTGIGLSIVQRVVDRHGGRVWAESKVGEGATFFFALPGVVA